MLYEQTVEKSTLELLNTLMADVSLSNFVLVGGTALTLQIGHRSSIDLDLFSSQSFDAEKLGDHLRTNYGFELDFISANTLKGEINHVQIDCIAHQYPWIEKPTLVGEIRLANLRDIAAMKLNAISGNGTRVKDFIDIAFLSSYISFKQMLKAYEQKYASNPVMPLKAIGYFNDINFNEPVSMVGKKPLNWKPIEKRLLEMQKFPDNTFGMIE